MDEYMTIKETAELWGVTPRWVQTLCINGKIEGAIKFGRAWAIPRNTPRPKDGRETSGKYKNWRKCKKDNPKDIFCHSEKL